MFFSIDKGKLYETTKGSNNKFSYRGSDNSNWKVIFFNKPQTNEKK